MRGLSIALRWPVGVVLTAWSYMWRTTPMHRSEESGDWAALAPPALPAGVSEDEVQRVTELSGGRLTGGIEVRTRRADAPG